MMRRRTALASIAAGEDPEDASAPGLTAGLDIAEARDFSARDAREMFELLYGAIEAARDLQAVTVCGCGARGGSKPGSNTAPS